MYESERNDSPKISSMAGQGMCKMPPRHFGVEFQPSNDFENGMGVAVIVDGVLCTSKSAASQLIGKRLDDIYQQWQAHVEKM